MKKRRHIIFLLSAAFMLMSTLAACAEREETASPVYPPENEKQYSAYVHVSPVYEQIPPRDDFRIDSSRRNPQLFSVSGDRIYLSYAQSFDSICPIDPDCTVDWNCPLSRGFNTRLAHMQTDGSDFVTFWEGEIIRGEQNRRSYIVQQFVFSMTNLPNGGVAAIICEDWDWKLPPLVSVEAPRSTQYTLLFFDANGNVTHSFDYLSLLPPALTADEWLWFLSLDIHALPDGRVVLLTEDIFFLFDPESGDSLQQIISLPERNMRLTSSTVLFNDEIIALVQPDSFDTREMQLWRICVHTGEVVVVSRGLETKWNFPTLQLGTNHDIYMQVHCLPGRASSSFEGGVVGVNLESGQKTLLFTWRDVDTDGWGVPFSTCDAGLIYFLRSLFEDEYTWEPTGTQIEMINPVELSNGELWACNCAEEEDVEW